MFGSVWLDFLLGFDSQCTLATLYFVFGLQKLFNVNVNVNVNEKFT